MKEFENDRDALMWLVGLIEGEGSFCVRNGRYDKRGSYDGPKGLFSLEMTDKDVVALAQSILLSWGVPLNLRTNKKKGDRLRVDGSRCKPSWKVETASMSYLKIIIDKTYDLYSEKKQDDCDKVLKNLAQRGYL